MYLQGVPEKNVPLGEGQTSPKGTFFGTPGRPRACAQNKQLSFDLT